MNTSRLILLTLCTLMAIPAGLQGAAKKEATPTQMVYTLPQTRIHVDIDVKHTVYKKGPYAEYANRMLGVQNLSMSDAEKWEILNVRVYGVSETDNSQIRSLTFNAYQQNFKSLLQISEAGLIADCSISHTLASSTLSESEEEFRFMNFTGKELTTEKVDTFYKLIMNDTAFIRQPVLQHQITSKSKESLAQDVATQIFDLRDKRFELLIGNVDNYPDGQALQIALQALNQEEELLLSMFIGARAESVQTHRFSFVPDQPGEGILTYFSAQNAFSNSNTTGTQPIRYQLSTNYSISGNQSESNAHILFYRTPVQCDVQVAIGNQMLVSKSLPVFQFGPLSAFPME